VVAGIMHSIAGQRVQAFMVFGVLHSAAALLHGLILARLKHDSDTRASTRSDVLNG
jgi:hypothetical protein